MEKAAMSTEVDESYALHFRWGSFRLSVTGRGPILAWATVIAAGLGFKLLWPIWH
jgi:hypothetical protein